MRLLFASNNEHKLAEVRQIMPESIEILGLSEVGFVQEIAETGSTLEENSRIKANAVGEWLQQHPEVVVDGIFADDTGLEIAALSGEPGVRTARWAGEDCIAANNRQKALRLLDGQTNRAACFRTVVTLIRDGKTEQVDGRVDGRIAEQECGDGGFGYDPVFIPKGYDSTFAELPAEVKNSISHRARAMEALRRLLLLFMLVLAPLSIFAADDQEEVQGVMGTWKLHPSYSTTTSVAVMGDRVFAVADESLFSVDCSDLLVETYTRMTGLTGSNVAHIAYDATTRQLLIVYTDSRMDCMDRDGNIYPMYDLYLKAQDVQVAVQSVSMHDGIAYLGMPFGIVAVNMRKHEIYGTYYIGEEGTSVSVSSIVVVGNTIYAVANQKLLYCAELGSVLEDYANWKQIAQPSPANLTWLTSYDGKLYALRNRQIYYYEKNGWWQVNSRPHQFIRASGGKLLGYIEGVGLVEYDAAGTDVLLTNWWAVSDAEYDNGIYWVAAQNIGLTRFAAGDANAFQPVGPYASKAFRMQFVNDKLFVAMGGRWAQQNQIPAHVITYQNGEWGCIGQWETQENLGVSPMDYLNYAVDPNDLSHFFATSYGMGVIEYRKNKPYKQYTTGTAGCTLEAAAPSNPGFYTRCDGAVLDSVGNLWVLNTGESSYPINLMTPQGAWKGVSMGSFHFYTPGEILIDRFLPSRKWMMECRSGSSGHAGLLLYYDNGTPTATKDDRYLFREAFTDQKGNSFSPDKVLCFDQDMDGYLWVGTSAGVFYLNPDSFFVQSLITRPLIRRNDGTDYADFLLSTEQVNCIAVDGGNRKWIGTQTSGLYLVSADGLETLAHYTEDNSNLPSSEIASIAINPVTGDVFVGTSQGIASFRADVSQPMEDMSSVFVYPNPVRRNYKGLITITGLMDHSWVNIVDGGGNLVFKTCSNGGTAVWDGTDQYGKRVATGVYSAMCNGDGGSTVVKILIMN